MEALLKKRQELKELHEQVSKAYDTVGSEGPTTEQVKTVSDLNKRIEEVSHAVKDLETMEGANRSAKEFLEDWNKPVNRGPQEKLTAAQIEKKVFGAMEQLKNNEGFQAWLKGGAMGNSPVIEIEGVKTLVTGASDTSAGALVINDRTNITDPGTVKKFLGVLDLIDVGTTQSDTVEFVKVTSFTNNAAETAEATTTSNGGKPESAAALAVVQRTVQTLAHFIPVTRRALADAGQIDTLLRDLLGYGLRERLNAQVIGGDGVSPNLEGIANTSGISTQAWSSTMLETTRKARTKVKTQGKSMPTAFLLHPSDNEAIELLQDGENRYYFGGPTAYGIRTLWGLPVVEDETATQGVGYVADWKTVKLWVREQATIRVAEQHSDWFTKNIVAMLAEMRAAMGVVRPAAVVSIDLTAL